MPRIKNPNPDGRVVTGLGVIAGGETRDVSEDLAAELCDGVNFVRADRAEDPITEDLSVRKSRPKTSNSD